MTVQASRDTLKIVDAADVGDPISFNQYVESATHMRVYADTDLASVGTHYTVSATPSDGITITITAAGIALGATTWTLEHRPPLDQNADLSVGGTFGTIYENSIDAVTRRLQSIGERLDRSYKSPVNDPLSDPTVTPGSAGEIVVFDAYGNLVGGGTYGSSGGGINDPVAPITLYDFATAHLATIVSEYSVVQTLAYDQDISPTRGGARYRASTLIETSNYPASAWFLTVNGRYFLLDELEPTLDMVGGVPDCVLDDDGIRLSGTDNAEAWDDFIQFCRVSQRPGRIPVGAYYAFGERIHDAGVSIRGAGKGRTVIHTRAPAGDDTVESANPAIFVTGSNSELHDLTSSIEATEVKPIGAGDGHACVLVGYHAFTETEQPELTGIKITGIRCHRAANGIDPGDPLSSGGGVFVVGNVGDFLVYDIDDKGSPAMHSGLAQCHWSGLNTAGGYGFESTVTYHVHRGEWDRLRAERSFTGLTWSSTFDMHCGTLSVKNVDTLFYWLPGDETNRIALIDYRDRVGRGNRIDRIFYEDLNDDVSENGINMFSVGTSSFAKYAAPDATIGLKQNLYTEFSIGSIIGIATTPRAKALINCTQFYGNFRVDYIDVGTSVTKDILEIDKSDGIHIGHVKGKAAYSSSGAIVINNVRNIHIDCIEVEHTSISSAANRVLFVEGGSFTRTLAADAAQGATEIFVNALVEDCIANQPILVNGHLVYADNFYEGNVTEGCTRIGISPLPTAATTGQTVTFDKNSTFDIGLQTKGGGTAARVANARGKLWGTVQEYGIIGFSFLSGAIVDVIAPRSRGGGRLKATSGGTVTKEFESFDGSQVYVHGGVIGVDGEYVQYNVQAAASGSPDNRIVLNGTRVQTVGSSGFIDAGSATDYDTINVRDSNGALLGKGTRSGSKTFDPGSIADGDHETTTVTVTGAALGDTASANFSLSQAGVILSAYVSAADTVTCVFGNLSGGAIDLGSGTLTAYATRR